ncbi:hypothetical protein, partial [Xanthomonas oryzae]|uniref:hypothetical protein n=1 Tax=Xanthomonas oryzae TaxID=347 RepID=UPI003CE4626C
SDRARARHATDSSQQRRLAVVPTFDDQLAKQALPISRAADGVAKLQRHQIQAGEDAPDIG